MRVCVLLDTLALRKNGILNHMYFEYFERDGKVFDMGRG